MTLRKMMNLLSQADMFCSSQMLRHHTQSQYKTLAGGIISLVTIFAITIGFINTIAETVNRTTINSALVFNKEIEPSYATLYTGKQKGKQNRFMLLASIMGVGAYVPELSQAYKYFTVEMHLQERSSSDNYWGSRKVALEHCTKSHLDLPQYQKSFDSFGLNTALCLPLNASFPIQGTYTSEMMNHIQISVSACVNQTSNNTCASQAEIDALFAKYNNFNFVVSYTDPVINPNQQEYIKNDLETIDTIIFSQDIGSQAMLYLSDYKITTDDSIWPYSSYLKKQGLLAQQRATISYFSLGQSRKYATLFLLKSPTSISYVRQVQKLSTVLSNIGGLIGAVTAALFLLKSYTESSLEIAIGLDLFRKDQDESPNKNNNFLNILRLTFYRILKEFGWKGVSQFSQQLDKYQKQTVKQLDVVFLLRRLIKLESAIVNLLPKQEIQKIWEKQPITVDHAKRMRSLVSKEQTNEDENTQSPRVDSECMEKSGVIFKIPKNLIQKNDQLRSNNGLSSINKNIVEIEDLQCSEGGTIKDKKNQLPKNIQEFRGILFNPKQREIENKSKNFVELYK